MKNLNLINFIRSDIAEMEEYIAVPSKEDLSRDIIKLDAGENQFGYSPKVTDSMTKNGLYNFYPDPEYKELRQKIARYAGVKTENIMVGNGSDELLDLTLRLILNEGDKVLNCPPTFGMYSVLTGLNKGIPVSIPRNNDFSLNIARIKKACEVKTKAIIVCSPNNPTGTVSSEFEIIKLLKTRKLIIVDEAYFEYYGKTLVPLLTKYDNLIVLRTFSKWAGLAGLRLGYVIASPFFIIQLLKIKPPYNVNSAANNAGIVALSDLNFYKKIIRETRWEREILIRELNKFNILKVYPSMANLLFVRIKGNLSRLRKIFIKNRIAVRYYDDFNAFRFSIGTPKQNNKVIKVLKEFVNGKN